MILKFKYKTSAKHEFYRGQARHSSRPDPAIPWQARSSAEPASVLLGVLSLTDPLRQWKANLIGYSFCPAMPQKTFCRHF
jgi:hypothetical protein